MRQRRSTLSGRTAGKPGLLEKSPSTAARGRNRGHGREANSIRLKIGRCHGQSQHSGKSELGACRKLSLIYLGDTSSDLWKGLENPAERDLCKTRRYMCVYTMGPRPPESPGAEDPRQMAAPFFRDDPSWMASRGRAQPAASSLAWELSMLPRDRRPVLSLARIRTSQASCAHC